MHGAVLVYKRLQYITERPSESLCVWEAESHTLRMSEHIATS